MFTKLYFYCDLNGKPLLKSNDPHREEPLLLEAKHCNAKYFYLQTAGYNAERGTLPAIYIKRALGPLGKDPYNEDGQPSNLLTTIVTPHIEFVCGTIRILGLEDPNLCCAGWLYPPYTNDYKLIKGVNYLTEEQKNVCDKYGFWTLKQQKIVLTWDHK